MPRSKDKKIQRNNHKLSLTVAKSISEVIKFSVDDNFRKHSFKALGVISTKDFEREVYKKLLICTDNPGSLFQTISDEEGENEYIQKNETINLPEDLSEKERKCEELNEYKPDLSTTLFSQICLQISLEQERRSERAKSFNPHTNSELTNPWTHKPLL